MNRGTGVTAAIALVILVMVLCFSSAPASAGTVTVINNCPQNVTIQYWNNRNVGIWRSVHERTLTYQEADVFNSECVMKVDFYNLYSYRYRCVQGCMWDRGDWVSTNIHSEAECVDGCYWLGCGDAKFEIYTDSDCNCLNTHKKEGMNYCTHDNQDKSKTGACPENSYFTCKIRRLPLP